METLLYGVEGAIGAVFMAILVGSLVLTFFSAIVIYIVAKLRFGIEVDGFGSAFFAAITIGILHFIFGGIVSAFDWTYPSGWLGVLAHLVVAGVVISTAGAWVKGFRSRGFLGAMFASVAIGLITFLIVFLLGLSIAAVTVR